MSYPSDSVASRLSFVQWLIVIIAAIGFAFDIYELLMMQFVLAPAVSELKGVSVGSPEFDYWRNMMFWLPMVLGGAFGLVGGYLTDYLGRRRMLVWSILLYAFSAFFAGFSTSMPMLLVLRCTTLIGVCIEFVAAVAWLAELFPNPKQREAMLGYSQAFSSIGGLLVAVVFGFLTQYAGSLPAISIPGFLEGWLGNVGPTGQHAAWRCMLMSGVIPALPLILVRPFLPESPVWQQKKQAGTLKRPSFVQLFQGELLRPTIVTTLMVACCYGVALGCIQQVPQMLAPVREEGKPPTFPLPEVAAAVKEAQDKITTDIAKVEQSDMAADKKAAELAKLKREREGVARKVVQGLGSTAGKFQEVGGLVGRFILAYLAVIIVGRRFLIRLFLIPGLVVVPIVFAYAAVTNLDYLNYSIFLLGLFTVAQFSFWGNYLPRVYPTHLRGTGESFAANVGGRILGTSAVLLTTQVQTYFDPKILAPHRLAYAAAAVGVGLYSLNLILSFFLPEPKQELSE